MMRGNGAYPFLLIFRPQRACFIFINSALVPDGLEQHVRSSSFGVHLEVQGKASYR